MEKGSNLSESRKKDTLRNKMATYKHKYEQLQHDSQVKERCYQNVMKQRDDAEVKVKLLTKLIDDDLMLNSHQREIASSALNKIGV